MAKPSGVSLLAYEYRGELFDDMVSPSPNPPRPRPNISFRSLSVQIPRPQVFFDAANEAFEVEPLSLRPYEGELEDSEYEDSRWLYTYKHKA